MTDNTNIEACPCCNEKASMRTSHDTDGCFWAHIECNKCGMRSRGDWLSNSSETCPIFYQGIRDQWNRRAALSNAEPVGYIRKDSIDLLKASNIGGAMVGLAAVGSPDDLPLFLHPSVLAPLIQAAQAMLQRYTALVNSGDAGNWNPEEEIEVINLRAALVPLTNTGEQR